MSSQLTNKQKAIIITKKSLFILWTCFKWVFIFGLVGSFLVGGVVAGYVTSLVRDEPVRDKAMMLKEVGKYDVTGFVYFNDGTLVGQLRTDEDRRLALSIDEVPQVLRDAFIAVEDFRFEEHYGVDLIGTVRAAKQKFLNEDTQTGGSTITQQLARRVFLSLEQTDSRKFKEIFLAMRMERMMTKDDILLAYMNKMPFGNGSSGYNVYGVKAAAKGIFDVDDLHQLNIAQSAYLAGLLKAPSDYSAFTSKGKFDEEGFDKAMARQKVVLSRMLEVGKITKAEYDEASAYDVKATLAKTKEKAYTTYPYLMIEAERRAAEILLQMENPELTEADLRSKANAELVKDAIDMMNRSGYKIYTTIDKTMYDAMREIAKNPENFSKDHPEKGIEQTGAMMIDNATGKILSMMEGRDYYVEQLNHATQMTRQPGSAMKLFAYLPALETGIIQPGMPIDDVPIILKDGVKGAHIPDNHDNKFHGFLTARRALDQSYNIPALKLFLSDYGGVGIETSWDYAQRMGITTLTKQDNTAQTGVIGGLTNGVSVEELTNAYSTVPNKGVFKDAYMIDRIEDAEGNAIYKHTEAPVTIYSEETAYLMTDMLRTVVSNGTAGLIKSRFKSYGKIPIYGKTGTTSNDYDVWFVGFTPDVTLGVWTGYDKPSKLITGSGTNRSKEIWAMIMNTAVEKKPDWFKTEEIKQPANIVKATVSSISGKLPNELTTAGGFLSTDLFNKKFLPTQEEDMLTSAKLVRFNRFNYLAQPGTPADFIVEKVVVNRQKPMKAIIDEIKAIFEKYPKAIPTKKGGKKTPEDYYTPDMEMDAPTEVDPRVDDGAAPSAPTGVTLKKVDNFFKILYQPAAQEDIIGYRLYISKDLGPFVRYSGLVRFTGDEPVFMIPAGSASSAFYVTAVDVAGHESPASNYVFAGDGFIDPNILPPADNGGSSGGGDTGSQSGSPQAPQGLTVKAREDGVGILLEWQASNESVARYNVYYSGTINGEFSFIGSTDKTRFEYISFPSEGWYRITAVNQAGESSPSQAVEMKSAE